MAYCRYIPAPDASAETLFESLTDANSLDYYSDQEMAPYAAYFYQSATQLGGPRYPEAHLRPLLNYAGQDVSRNYLPFGVDKDFDPQPMRLVERWARESAERVMLIYGENDPWFAGAFEVDPASDRQVRVALGREQAAGGDGGHHW